MPPNFLQAYRSALTSAILPSVVWLGSSGTGLITPTRHEMPGEKVDLQVQGVGVQKVIESIK